MVSCFYHQVCGTLCEEDNKRSKQFTAETVPPPFPMALWHRLPPLLFPSAHAAHFPVRETRGRRNSSKVRSLDERNEDGSSHGETQKGEGNPVPVRPARPCSRTAPVSCNPRSEPRRITCWEGEPAVYRRATHLPRAPYSRLPPPLPREKGMQ